jgi:hypothetical protein
MPPFTNHDYDPFDDVAEIPEVAALRKVELSPDNARPEGDTVEQHTSGMLGGQEELVAEVLLVEEPPDGRVLLVSWGSANEAWTGEDAAVDAALVAIAKRFPSEDEDE